MSALTAIQHGAEWSDARMARELGISPAMWSLVRRGHRQPGSRVLGGIERRFPDLHPQVMQDSTGHWWVSPNGYARVATNPEAEAASVREVVRAEIASHFERFAAQLRGEA